jgi:acetyl esterase/lipase
MLQWLKRAGEKSMARLGLGLLLGAIGLFLSVWIVLPPPIFFLLRLAVGAPEVSPWLVGVNAIALFLLLVARHSLWRTLAIVCVVVGLCFSALPLLQLPTTLQQANNMMQKTLGSKGGRSHPFVLLDVFRGIPISPSRTSKTIAFAQPEGVPLNLNLYRPSQTGPHPTLVMIHGGGWQGGSPNDNSEFSRYMAGRGYTVVSIDYRLAPRFKFPAQLNDVRTAIAYIQEHADELEVDVARMAIMGRSAGAHLAMLVAYGENAPPVKAVVNYYGPVDLTRGYYEPPNPDPIETIDLLEDFLGGTPKELAERYKEASPITHVQSQEPPSLLIYGQRDHVVQSKFGKSLYDRLQATGNQAFFLEIPWAEHAFDAIFPGVSSQMALYYTERFLAWALNK